MGHHCGQACHPSCTKLGTKIYDGEILRAAGPAEKVTVQYQLAKCGTAEKPVLQEFAHSFG